MRHEEIPTYRVDYTETIYAGTYPYEASMVLRGDYILVKEIAEKMCPDNCDFVLVRID